MAAVVYFCKTNLLVVYIYASRNISKHLGLIDYDVLIRESQNSRETSLFETGML